MNKMITTGFAFEGYRIVEYLGLVTSQSALPATEKRWADLRGAVCDDLLCNLPSGANAVIGAQVAHNHFHGSGIAALFYFFITGTAVRIEKV